MRDHIKPVAAALLVGIAFLGLVATAGAATASGASLEERNKAVVRRFLDARNGQEAAAVLKEVSSSNYRQGRAEFQNLESNASASQLQALAQPLRVALPDRTDTIEEMVAEGDKVAVLLRIRGSHKGNFLGIPATGRPIDVNEIALFKVVDGLLVESWFMADEAGLLRQLGTGLPPRNDGRRIIPPAYGEARDGNEVLAEILAHPVDSQTFRNKVMVAAYKSASPPRGILPDRPGAPYDEYLRPGYFHLTQRGTEIGQGELKIPQAFPDRRDRIAQVLAEGDRVFMLFQLNGTNTKSLFGMPPSNARVAAWEAGFMQFDGSRWKSAWWFGDDLGLLLQINGPQSFLVPER